MFVYHLIDGVLVLQRRRVAWRKTLYRLCSHSSAPHHFGLLAVIHVVIRRQPSLCQSARGADNLNSVSDVGTEVMSEMLDEQADSDQSDSCRLTEAVETSV